MKKTILILLFLATYIFANEIANNDLLKLNYEYSKRIYSYLEKFENKKLEEELKKGLNPKSILVNLKTPRPLISIATSFKNTKAVKLLIKYGANPNLVLTPYIIRDDLEMVEYLLEQGASIERIEKYNESICSFKGLIPSFFHVKSKEMIDFLISKGVKIDYKMENGKTILDYLYENVKLREYIIDNYNLEQEYFICDYPINSLENPRKFKVKHFYDKYQRFELDGSLEYEIPLKID